VTRLARQSMERIGRSVARMVTVLGCATLAGVLAFAGGPSAAVAGPADNETRAYAIYKEAKEKYDAKDFERAAELAEQAEKLFPHPNIMLLKGSALRQLGKLREAEAAFKQCKVQAAQLSKKALQNLTDEILAVSDEMRSKGELVVVVEPAGEARVQIDGTEVVVPYARWIAPGRKKVEAGAPGRKPVTREVDVTAGATAEVKINLDRRDGKLVVVVPGGLRGVTVRLDGHTIDIDDAARIGDRTVAQSVEPGVHEVICARGDRQVGTKIEVAADAQVDARCDGLEGGGLAPRKLAGWGGVLAGAGIFGFGAVNVSYYAYKSSNGFVEKVPDGSVSRLTGGLGYAVVGAAVSVASWLLFVRDGETRTAASIGGDPGPWAGSMADVTANRPTGWAPTR